MKRLSLIFYPGLFLELEAISLVGVRPGPTLGDVFDQLSSDTLSILNGNHAAQSPVLAMIFEATIFRETFSSNADNATVTTSTTDMSLEHV